MAEPNDAGTPPAEVPVSESAGTGAQAVDGSEQTAKPVDPALAMAWKAKAERVNDLEARLNATQERLNAIYAAQAAQQQQANPVQQMVAQLQERAQYGDADAATQLSIMTMAAQQAAETELTNEMVKAQVPADKWDTVRSLVRQSGYRTPVSSALQLARGSEVPDLAKQLEAERERVKALERALNSRTVGNAPSGNPATTTPAAASEGPLRVTLEEYNALPKELRDKASIRR